MSLSEKIRNESWDQIQMKLGDRQAETLNALNNQPKGITAWEIAQITGRMIHTVRPRLTELKSYGLADVIGRRYHSETDRMESIWVPIDNRFDDKGQGRLL